MSREVRVGAFRKSLVGSRERSEGWPSRENRRKRVSDPTGKSWTSSAISFWDAYALHLGDTGLATSLREAEELFIAEHLAYLSAGLENRLEESYLRAPVELLARRLGLFSAEVLESATRPALAESDVPTCGMV